MRPKFTFLFSFLLIGCIENTTRLENMAKDFCVGLGYDVIGVKCMNRDTDNDGYMSCAANIGGGTPPLQIECSSQYSILSNGCRLVKPTLRGFR
jgi:outer membrane cobalamin receptor